MTNLIHIVYVSFAYKALSEKELEALLTGIRKKNEQRNVTGLLLYNDLNFIQVIEGTEETIHNLFKAIEQDTRHTNVVKLLEESIENRAFPDWSMGFRRISKKQTSRIPGFSDFLTGENPEKFISGSTEQVMYLLDSFRKYT
ncbi:MAG: BLUF domain-containing protein [Bacteroidota bacterium]